MSPKMAQTLARHSDVRLTLGVYTHVGLHDQTAAIESLPAPPSVGNSGKQPTALRATGTDGIGEAPETDKELVPTMVPSGAVVPASKSIRIASDCTEEGVDADDEEEAEIDISPVENRTFCTEQHQAALPCTVDEVRQEEVSPTDAQRNYWAVGILLRKS